MFDKVIKYYEEKKIEKSKTEIMIITLNNYIDFLKLNNYDISNPDQLDEFISLNIKNTTNTLEKLLALARYFYLEEFQEQYVHMTQYFGVLDVIENIQDRIKTYASEESANKIFGDLKMYDLGTSPKDITKFTEKLINNIESHLSCTQIGKCLAGNNHNVSKDNFLREKEIYERSLSLDDYLADLHDRKVQELELHLKENRVWFEQIITQDVVDYVKENQEILSAVRVNDKLYITKIPYDTNAYLQSKTIKEKAYYACHCPFARESTLQDDVSISPNWCYCSGGFQKYMFDVIFEKDLEVKVLKTALGNDGICQFEIDIKDVDYKKK